MRRKNNSRLDSTPRILWLLNHSSARKFEVPILRQLGYEVFTPKSYPNDANFRSASTDFSEDGNLTIPAGALEVMNKADWYAGANNAAWEVANAYFDMAFFILFNVRGVEVLCRKFKGELLWRTYGLAGEITYSRVLSSHPEYLSSKAAFRRLGSRFWFAEGYSNLHEVEDAWLQSRTVYLPLGMAGASSSDGGAWSGGDKRILFVCPDIGFNPPYAEIYHEFTREFKGFPYAIGGAQSVPVNDPNVLGYLRLEDHQRNMNHLQLMFYHSREPRHIHYHPFEAVQAGMPLIFMSGGMLDRMGGESLPGRAKTWEEARRKARRILDGDQQFTDHVRETQRVLLDRMKSENLRPHWEIGFNKIRQTAKGRTVIDRGRATRIAVLSDCKHADEALLTARALVRGAELENATVDVVLGIERSAGDDATSKPATVSNSENIRVREFTWSEITRAQAERALIYAGAETQLVGNAFHVPDDQINFFQDCDLWVVVGGRRKKPLLPLKPNVAVLIDSLDARALTKGEELCLPRMGLIPSPSAVIVPSDEHALKITQMEGVDPSIVRVVNHKQSDTSVFEVVFECL